MNIRLLFFLTLLIFSCSETVKELPLEQLVQRNGLTYEVNKESPFSGKVMAKYENQQIELTGFYKNGLKEKTWTSFKENGQRLKVENYLQGFLNGVSEEYDDKGQLLFSREFKNDSLNGRFIKYDSIGRPKKEGRYKNNSKHGIWTEYRWDASIKKEEYKEDILDGQYSETNKDGIVILEGTYKEGRKQDTFVQRNDDGNIYREQVFKFGDVIASKEWDKFGNLSVEQTFPGLCKWYIEGKQVSEGYFIDKDGLNEDTVKMWYANKPTGVYPIVNNSIWKGEYFNSNKGRYKEYYQFVFNSDRSYHKGYYFSTTPNETGYSARMQPQERGRWSIRPDLKSLYIQISKGRNDYVENYLSISKLSQNEIVIDGKKYTRVE